jgi:hypothetical protein
MRMRWSYSANERDCVGVVGGTGMECILMVMAVVWVVD